MDCPARAKSAVFRGHVHVCAGDHFRGMPDHWCPKCKRWWYAAGEEVLSRSQTQV